MRIQVEGYLVQKKLEEAIRTVTKSGWRGREVNVPGTRYRWDMMYELNGTSIAVEFDGDEHYRDTRKIRVDREKDKIAEQEGYSVVRFPYWVQLTTQTLQFYFGLDAEIIQDFQHGFISIKARLPASFCELGVSRFKTELDRLPQNIRGDVLNSLRKWSEEYGIEYVMPSCIVDLL